MKAVVVETPGKIVAKEVPTPKLTADNILLRVQASSICNLTDAHIVNGTFSGYHDFYPQILGHEAYGEVVEVGANVKSCVKGDKLVLYSGWGAFCEYLAFNPDEWSYWAKVPAGLNPESAVLCEMLHGAYVSLVSPAEIKSADNVLLIGQGPMGLSAMQCARLAAKTITVVDMFQYRLDKAKQLGADFAYDRSKMSSGKILAEIKKEIGAIDIAFMCIDMDLSKELDAFDLAVQALKERGKLSSLNVFVKNGNQRMNPAPLNCKDIHMQHTLGPAPMNHQDILARFAEAVQLVAAGKINLGELITHRVDCSGVADAIKMCEHYSHEVIKVIVKL